MSDFRGKGNRILALLMSAALAASSLAGCGSTGQSAAKESTESSSDEPWSAYEGNLDTFVYGLLGQEYDACYNTFNAAVDLPDGSVIYGIGYTDYMGFIERDDGEGYFPAGFIGLIGEPAIPSDLSETATVIHNLDVDEEPYGYLLAYDTKPFMEQCVIWNQYLQYGVDDTGCITYKAEPYSRDVVDEDLGALYSYDESKYLYDPDVGDPVRVTGTSLVEELDYAAIEDEVNRIIKEQDYNFAESDVETTLYIAQEKVTSALLSMQEETFIGCDVDELIELTKQLDPKECVRFTEDGMATVDLDETPPAEPDKLSKWLVGMACGAAITGSIALNIFMPAATPFSGAVSGAASEVFMEVVIQNQALTNVDWGRVAVASASAAALAWACPLLAERAAKGTVALLSGMNNLDVTGALGKLAGYGVQTCSNGLVTGVTSATFAVMDGKSGKEVKDAFTTGFVVGAVCTAVAAAGSEALNGSLNVLENKNPDNWFVKLTKETSETISEHQQQFHLKNQNVEDILAPKSVNEAVTTAVNDLKVQRAGSVELYDKIQQLPADNNKNLMKCDPDTGEPLTKAQLEENGGNCVIKLRDDCSNAAREAFKAGNTDSLNVIDGDPQFQDVSAYTFQPSGKMTPNRDKNYAMYKKDLANMWSEKDADIPDFVKQYLADHNLSPDELNSTVVGDILSDSHLTPHEMTTEKVALVPADIHRIVSHYGGVAHAKVMAALHIGKVYFKELCRPTASGVTGTLIAEEAQ